jgi:hypothetical protein
MVTEGIASDIAIPDVTAKIYIIFTKIVTQITIAVNLIISNVLYRSLLIIIVIDNKAYFI